MTVATTRGTGYALLRITRPGLSIRRCLSAAAAMALLTIAAGCSEKDKPPTDSPRENAARSVCHQSVTQKINATGETTFADEMTESTNFGYKISGTVQTPDGAKSRFLCSAEQNGADWVAAEIVIDPA